MFISDRSRSGESFVLSFCESLVCSMLSDISSWAFNSDEFVVVSYDRFELQLSLLDMASFVVLP